jgi:hypothetical protein
MQQIHVVYAQATWRHVQLGLKLLDEGRRHLLGVRDDEKDLMDYLLECIVPVGPKRSRPYCATWFTVNPALDERPDEML